MNIKKIQDADVQGKKVLIRVDFNESLDDKGDVKSSYKIAIIKDTVAYLCEKGVSHIALMTHFGRPEGRDDKANSLEQIVDDVACVLGRDVIFAPDCIGACVTSLLQETRHGTIVLLENVRYYEEEEMDDDLFAQQLCEPFDLYVNEAFAVSHRKHASLHAITRHIPSYAGLWFQKEVENLSRIKNVQQHPAVAIIGGAKIETKIPMIKEFSEKYDHVLVGGRSAVEAKDKKMIFNDKVMFPSDFAENYFDIGPETIMQFSDIIRHAKTIVWNGPMGKIEESAYKIGTVALMHAIAENTEAFSLIGGGESVQIAEESGLIKNFSFVSTGGGAMLAFLGGESMPSIDVLEINN